MSALGDLVAAAQDDTVQLSAVLRKALVLAYRLNIPEMIEWVQLELNGYGTDADLPEYRLVVCKSYANLVGDFGRQLQGVEVRAGFLPEDVRNHIWEPRRLDTSVAHLQSLVDSSGRGDTLRVPWGSVLAAKYATVGFANDFECLNAWWSVPAASIVSLLETIRNRLLVFALEWERQFGDRDLPLAGASIPDPVRTGTFNLIVKEGASVGSINIASDYARLEANVSKVSARDSVALGEALQALGLNSEQTQEATALVKSAAPTSLAEVEDLTETLTTKFREAIHTSVGGLPAAVAGGLLAKALAAYFGLGV